MKAFVINLFLALVLSSLLGRLTLGGMLLSFAVGYLLLYWLRPLLGGTTYFEKFRLAAGLALFLVKDILVSDFRVAREVLMFRPQIRAGFIAVPLTVRSNFEILFLQSLITLTPGTMGVDVSGDRRVLYVHTMFVTTPDEVRNAIKNGLERRILELFR
jgi:multicomponent Na+:H+ antiporter subunit E